MKLEDSAALAPKLPGFSRKRHAGLHDRRGIRVCSKVTNIDVVVIQIEIIEPVVIHRKDASEVAWLLIIFRVKLFIRLSCPIWTGNDSG